MARSSEYRVSKPKPIRKSQRSDSSLYDCKISNSTNDSSIHPVLQRLPISKNSPKQASDRPENKKMQPLSARAVHVQDLMKGDAAGLPNCQVAEGIQLKYDLLSSATKLNPSEVETCLNLIEETSGADYRASSVGWDPVSKKLEMMDEDMMYLLVRQEPANVSSPAKGKNAESIENGSSLPHSQAAASMISSVQNDDNISGFISFMFTYDDPPNQDREVVYIYEIHLRAQLRGCGLGSRLIKFVEKAAHGCGISKTMLTVFTKNKGARLLYERLGYTKDECSPKDRVMRSKTIKADYQIMSKEVSCNV